MKDENNNDFRASVIFPIFCYPEIRNSLMFLSYWLLRHLSEVQIKLTLRDQDGNILYDHYLQVNHIKPYQIFIDELFPKYRDYLGNVLTVEVQVYFSSKPRFTYPAISLLVTDGKRNSVVHGGLRFYNPSEDGFALTQPELPQTGFDIWTENTEFEPYLIIVGDGSKHGKYTITLINQLGEPLVKKYVSNDNLKKYQTLNLNLKELFSNFEFQPNFKVNISSDSISQFPRYYCGFRNGDKAFTLTHTFYDTSSLGKPYYVRVDDTVSSSVIQFPSEVFFDALVTTEIVSYGCNQIFNGEIALQFLDASGKQVREKNSIKAEDLNSQFRYTLPRLSDYKEDSSLEISTFRLEFNALNGAFPGRYKIGLNYFTDCDPGVNICVGTVVATKNILSKASSSRWGPIGGDQNFKVFLSNTTFKLNCPIVKHALLTIKIYNWAGEAIEIEMALAPNASAKLCARSNDKIIEHLKDQLGYVYVQSSSCVIDAYYFSEENSLITGDHLY